MNKNIQTVIQRKSRHHAIPSDHQFELWVKTAVYPLFKKGEVLLRVVSEKEMQQLNATYRNQDKPTNVLSFPFENSEELPLPLLGDIILCAKLIEKEAKQQKKSSEAHWAHLVIHGCLHCLGYDHETKKDATVMELLEIKLLKKLKYQNPYGEK